MVAIKDVLIEHFREQIFYSAIFNQFHRVNRDIISDAIDTGDVHQTIVAKRILEHAEKT